MGRPAGSQNKDKPFRDALRLEIKAAEDSPRALRQIANKLIDLAASGDMQAIKEIGDRLDGKPAQEATVNVNRTDVRERTDAELAEILAGADRGGEGDANTALDPSKLN